ncbi:MAG: glycosyltransferase family 2 protein, partial [Rhizobiaceae bacterium]
MTALTYRLSILVVVYDMQREAPRTIASMLPPYQKSVSVTDYEILILDNGSKQPLPKAYIAGLPANVRYLPVPDPSGSPGNALNWGARQARAEKLMFCIDGARILSNGLVSSAIDNLDRFPDA